MLLARRWVLHGLHEVALVDGAPLDLVITVLLQVLQLKLPFDEAALVQENQEYLCHALGLEAIHVVTDQAQSHQARPAQPLITCS